MSPTPGGPPGQRSAAAAFGPIVVAVCAIVLVREGLGALAPRLSTWVVFVVALAVGWLAYTTVERYYTRREGPRAARAPRTPERPGTAGQRRNRRKPQGPGEPRPKDDQ
ncbi:hypothetical protein [Pedococcus sp. 5OH_020]|uniref:hypothetical protein n=1 Tax=Pedococcus sp. 5OH_020 TaxID=2989814 RepID=UPI0022EA0556|nr:hypothetical protein [Pedococcus sp. 5OH_020]